MKKINFILLFSILVISIYGQHQDLSKIVRSDTINKLPIATKQTIIGTDTTYMQQYRDLELRNDSICIVGGDCLVHVPGLGVESITISYNTTTKGFDINTVTDGNLVTQFIPFNPTHNQITSTQTSIQIDEVDHEPYESEAYITHIWRLDNQIDTEIIGDSTKVKIGTYDGLGFSLIYHDSVMVFTPTNNNLLTNGAGYLTTETDPVYLAWDKDYDDLTNKPTLSDLNYWTDDGVDLYYTGKNVGVNTSSPSELFEVYSQTAHEGAEIGSGFYGNWYAWNHMVIMNRLLSSTTTDYALVQGNTGKTLLNAASGQDIDFRINNSSKMSLGGTGQLSIGTTDDYTHELNVKGALSAWNNDAGKANGKLVLRALNGTNVRATGMYMHDEGGDLEWFIGRSYLDSDKLIFARKSTVTHDEGTAEEANSIFTITPTDIQLKEVQPYYQSMTTGSGSNAAPTYSGVKMFSLSGTYEISAIEGVSRAANSAVGELAFKVASDINTPSTNQNRMTISGNGGVSIMNLSDAIIYADSNNELKELSLSGLSYSNGVLTNNSVSLWTENLGDIYRSTGNVGIGTTTPDTKLNIEGGNIRVDNTDIGEKGGSVIFGRDAMLDNTVTFSTAIGAYSMENATTGVQFSVAIGEESLRDATGNENVGIGYRAGKESGTDNVYIGAYSGEFNTGNENVAIGYTAGQDNDGSGNVFIGNDQDAPGVLSNKLRIGNANADALIEGDFSTDDVKINGDLETTGSLTIGNILTGDSDGFLGYNSSGEVFERSVNSFGYVTLDDATSSNINYTLVTFDIQQGEDGGVDVDVPNDDFNINETAWYEITVQGNVYTTGTDDEITIFASENGITSGYKTLGIVHVKDSNGDDFRVARPYQLTDGENISIVIKQQTAGQGTITLDNLIAYIKLM